MHNIRINRMKTITLMQLPILLALFRRRMNEVALSRVREASHKPEQWLPPSDITVSSFHAVWSFCWWVINLFVRSIYERRLAWDEIWLLVTCNGPLLCYDAVCSQDVNSVYRRRLRLNGIYCLDAGWLVPQPTQLVVNSPATEARRSVVDT